jgi:hypothetical protein
MLEDTGVYIYFTCVETDAVEDPMARRSSGELGGVGCS